MRAKIDHFIMRNFATLKRYCHKNMAVPFYFTQTVIFGLCFYSQIISLIQTPKSAAIRANAHIPCPPPFPR